MGPFPPLGRRRRSAPSFTIVPKMYFLCRPCTPQNLPSQPNQECPALSMTYITEVSFVVFFFCASRTLLLSFLQLASCKGSVFQFGPAFRGFVLSVAEHFRHHSFPPPPFQPRKLSLGTLSHVLSHFISSQRRVFEAPLPFLSKQVPPPFLLSTPPPHA